MTHQSPAKRRKEAAEQAASAAEKRGLARCGKLSAIFQAVGIHEMLPTRVTRERKYGKHAFIHVWQARVVSEAWARADLVRVARDLRRRGCSSKLVVCAVRDIVAGKEISNEKVTDALLRDAELRLRGVL